MGYLAPKNAKKVKKIAYFDTPKIAILDPNKTRFRAQKRLILEKIQKLAFCQKSPYSRFLLKFENSRFFAYLPKIQRFFKKQLLKAKNCIFLVYNPIFRHFDLKNTKFGNFGLRFGIFMIFDPKNRIFEPKIRKFAQFFKNQRKFANFRFKTHFS